MTAFIMQLFDLLGTIAFAASGAITAIMHRLDLFGIMFLSVITATGGGIARDVILGNTPPYSLLEPRYVIVCLVTALLIFVFARAAQRFSRLVLFFDAVGLGAFVPTGSALAYAHSQASLYLVLAMGMITAIGGSMARDIMVNQIPVVLRKTEVYATVCLAGSLIYYVAMHWTGNNTLAVNLSCFGTIGLRLLSMRYHLTLPTRDIDSNKDT